MDKNKINNDFSDEEFLDLKDENLNENFDNNINFQTQDVEHLEFDANDANLKFDTTTKFDSSNNSNVNKVEEKGLSNSKIQEIDDKIPDIVSSNNNKDNNDHSNISEASDSSSKSNDNTNVDRKTPESDDNRKVENSNHKEDNGSGLDDNFNNYNNTNRNDDHNKSDNLNNTPDNRSLKENANDAKNNFQQKKDQFQDDIRKAKDNVNDLKDNVQNFPENVKNKANDIQQKAKDLPNNIKDKAQNTRNKASEALKNRPKNMKDFKAKGSNVKDRLKNGAKQRAQQAGNKLKNSATDAAKEKMNANEAVQKAKKAVETAKKVKERTKKTIKIAKAAAKLVMLAAKAIAGSFPVFLTIIIIIVLVACIAAYMPGTNGSTKDENSNYVEADQKTIEKLHKLFEQYPNADATLAMAAVVYPYFDILWDEKTRSLVSPEYIEELEKEADETVEAIEESDDTEDIAGNDQETKYEDEYLIFFRKYKRRKNLKTLLKKLTSGEETFNSYLNDYYFSSDKGYKKMLADSRNPDKLKEYIIANLEDIKSYFVNYVYNNAICSTTLLNAGNVTTDELLNGTIYVDLKKPGCSNIGRCQESYYSTYLTMEEYVKGVVYEELGTQTDDVEVLAAQMTAAKTFSISRRPTTAAPLPGVDGAYVIQMLWSTADQDFCHVEKGCDSSDIKAYTGTETGGNTLLKHGRNRPPASEERKALLDKAWEISKSTYVVTKDSTKDNYVAAETGYYEGSGCKIGNCMEQTSLVKKSGSGMDFKSILSYYYTSFNLATIENNLSTLHVAGATVCTNRNANFSAERNKIKSLILSMSGQPVPYYIAGLADSSDLQANNFGTEVTPDADGNTKKGLGEVGFVNFVYWNVINENFGNTNDINKIINDDISYEVKKSQLLIGDIGISDDNTLIGVYLGDENWGYADAVTKNVVATVDNRFTKYRRLNYFKNEIYNFPIRTSTPTKAEWSGKDWFIYSQSNTGQCPWYAKNRAAEIVADLYANSSITLDTYNTIIGKIKSDKTYGSGRDFVPGAAGMSLFPSGSNNIDDVKAPAFMGMNSNTDLGKKHGHVAIIEYANPEEDKIIVTDGWCRGCGTSCASSFNCVRFGYNEYTYKSFKESFSWRFRGYIYFME